MKNSVKLAALLLAAATPLGAQVNAGDQAAGEGLPFNLTEVATFNQPWRIAFLPDGRMLVTEKVGPVWLVTQQGEKTPIANVPEVVYGGQGGMLGIYVSPTYATDNSVYLTYSQPNEGGSSLALARARLAQGSGTASLEGLQVVWRDAAGGSGGQFGGAVAFSPDGQYLYLTVGERQRFTPAQDPNSPLGKILRLTLDGRPAPGNPNAGVTGAATIPIINPPRGTEAAKTAEPVRQYTFPGPNLTPSETWTSGHRTPYGLAFGPDGRLWELEHGPQGGDELNLIEPGKNYGWPDVAYAANYGGAPIPSHDTSANFTKPVIYWNPVIAPGNLFFYSGAMFPQWAGSAFATGLRTNSLTRIVFDGQGGASPVERWSIGFPVRDAAVAPDGAIWMVAGANPGGLYRAVSR
jgi:glucose/arabinose dehydrogenase